MKRIVYKITFILLLSGFFAQSQIIRDDGRAEQLAEIIRNLKSRYTEVVSKDWMHDELNNTVFLVNSNQKWGVCLGRAEIINPQYDEVLFAAYPKDNKRGNFRFLVRIKDKWGIAYIQYEKYENNNGKEYRYKEILPVKYEAVNVNCNYAGYFDSRDELTDANIKLNNKWGVARQTYNGGFKSENLVYQEIIEPKYDVLKNNFYHGYAQVKIKEKWGILDITGKETTDIIYDEITETNSSCQNILGVRINKLWGIYDLETKQIISPVIYDYVECTGNPIKSNLVIVNKNGKSGLFNKLTKKETLYPENATFNAEANCYGVQKDSKWFLYNKDGASINSVGYDKIVNMNYRFSRVFVNGKMGLYDKFFYRELISPIYEDIEHYYNKTNVIYGVIKNNKWGLVDTAGKVIVEPQYEDKIWGCLLHEEARNNINVKLNKKWGIVNSSGDIVTPCKYDTIYKSNYYVPEGGIKFNKKLGMINLVSGREVLPPIYDEIITYMNPNNSRDYEYKVNHFFIVKLNGKLLFMDHDGKEIPDPHK